VSSPRRGTYSRPAGGYLTAISITLSLVVIATSSWLIVDLLPASTRKTSAIIAPSDLVLGFADMSRADARLVLALVATALLVLLGLLFLVRITVRRGPPAIAGPEIASPRIASAQHSERPAARPLDPLLLEGCSTPVSASNAAQVLDEELGVYGWAPDSRPGLAWLRRERIGRGSVDAGSAGTDESHW
jgi:hypothetical protein